MSFHKAVRLCHVSWKEFFLFFVEMFVLQGNSERKIISLKIGKKMNRALFLSKLVAGPDFVKNSGKFCFYFQVLSDPSAFESSAVVRVKSMKIQCSSLNRTNFFTSMNFYLKAH